MVGAEKNPNVTWESAQIFIKDGQTLMLLDPDVYQYLNLDQRMSSSALEENCRRGCCAQLHFQISSLLRIIIAITLPFRHNDMHCKITLTLFLVIN